MAYRKRILSEPAVRELLEELTKARSACHVFHRDAPIHGAHYRAASEVAEAITRFAEVATGDRDHFMPKPYDAPGPLKP